MDWLLLQRGSYKLYIGEEWERGLVLLVGK